MLRSVAALAAQGRCLLPEDALAAHGLVPEGVVQDPHQAALRPVLLSLAQEGRALLGQARGGRSRPRLPRRAIAAGLPAVLARRDLRRGLPAPSPRGLGDRLAVTLAGLTGQL
jgi:phytoene synthase